MKHTRIAISLLLVALLTATSCGSTGDTPSDETTPAVTTEQPEDIFAGLPEKKYDGREFNFLIREGELETYIVEESTGDVLDDAIYRRNSEVEQRFGVKINPIPIDGSWEANETYMNTIRTSVMSGAGDYDLIDGYAAVIGGAFGDGVCLNLWDVPHLRLNEKWWSKIVADELTVNGKLYAMTGDLALNMWTQLQALYFNKGMIEDYKRPSPYDRVKDGTWTLDAMLSDIKDVAMDLNNDGKITVDDQVGFLVYDELAVDNLHNAFKAPIATKDANGIPVLDMKNERLVNAVEAINKLINENPDAVLVDKTTPDIEITTISAFSSGRAMYYADVLKTCTQMRDSDTDFGILPLPKYDENQDSYYTTSRDGRSMFVIPVDVNDVEFAGLITEALAVASNKYVIPAYYDITLKTKSARDNDSSEMLDIIRDGFKLEFVAEYSFQVGGSGYIIRNCVATNQSYITTVDSNLSAYTESLSKFLEAYN